MDIHPEVAATSYGIFTPLLRAIDKFAVTRAHRVVVLSDEMRSTLEAIRNHNRPLSNTIVIPCLTQVNNSPAQTERASANEKISIIFAGNIGEFQALPSIVEGLRRSGQKNVDITLIGRGKMLSQLISQVKEAGLENQISFEDFMSSDELALRMASVDFGLVSLSKGVSRYAFPSKFTTLLSQGLPILVIADENSDLASIVKNWRIGITATQDPGEIAEAFKRISDSRPHLEQMRSQVQRCFREKFSDTVILEQWETILKI